MSIPPPVLSLITNRKLVTGRTLDQVVAEAVEGGVNHVQLREKDLGARELLTLAEWLKEVISGRALLVVNDRVDVAIACDADGVHLPESGMPTRVVRSMLGSGKLIGRSVHSVNDAVRVAREGVDYVQMGPVFHTSSHPLAEPLGLKTLEVAVREASVPIVAVGGIDASRIGDVFRTGVAGAAFISAVMSCDNPRAAAQELHSATVAALQQQ